MVATSSWPAALATDEVIPEATPMILFICCRLVQAAVASVTGFLPCSCGAEELRPAWHFWDVLVGPPFAAQTCAFTAAHFLTSVRSWLVKWEHVSQCQLPTHLRGEQPVPVRVPHAFANARPRPAWPPPEARRLPPARLLSRDRAAPSAEAVPSTEAMTARPRISLKAVFIVGL